MTKKNTTQFEGLIDAEAICPICGAEHQFKLNPGYPPKPARAKLDGKYSGRNYNSLSWKERCLYYFFRIMCDRCMQLRATPTVREALKRKEVQR